MEVIFLDCALVGPGWHKAFFRQLLQHPHHHRGAIDSKVPSGGGSRVTEAKPISAESQVGARHKLANLVLDCVSEVAHRYEGTRGPLEFLGDVGDLRGLVGVQEVVALGGDA